MVSLLRPLQVDASVVLALVLDPRPEPDLVQQMMALALMVWVTSCTAAMIASGVVASGGLRWESIRL